MEYLQLFDKSKNMIDEKISREDKKLVKDGKHFMIVLLFIENNGKFLIQLTSSSKKHEYATTGGHVTYGDTSLQTVIKEAKEELNLDLAPDDVKYIETIDYNICFCDVYYCNTKIDTSNIKLQLEEVENIYWLSDSEIEKLISDGKFRKSNIESYNKVKEYIKNS